MPKPPYHRRALLALLLWLPLLFQVLVVVAGVAAAMFHEAGAPQYVGVVMAVLAGAALLGHSARLGFQAVRDAHSPLADTDTGQPDHRVWVRYRPLVLVFSYTLIIALVGIFLPRTDTGAIFGNFASVFVLLHLTSSLVIAVVTLFEAPTPWFYLAPPLAVYCAYGIGMASAFRRIGTPPTRRPDRLLASFLLIVALLILTWRATQMTTGFLRASDAPALAESVFTADYHPLQPGNKLIPIPSPDLALATEHPRLDGATALYPVYAAAAQAIYQNTDAAALRSLVAYSTTPKAYERLVRGEVDLILVAQPSPAQRAAAEAAGVELKLTPIGREAFVFFVHADNPITGLTTAQIRAIYTKRIVNWSELGGRDEAILPFQRPAGSGSQTALELKVMQGEPLPAPLREEYNEGMGGILQRVAAYRNAQEAIGYSFRVFATVMSPVPDLKLLAIDGIAPTPETIAAGTYPYTVDIFAATTDHVANPHVQPLIDWFLGPQGQTLIERTGYVSLPTSNPPKN